MVSGKQIVGALYRVWVLVVVAATVVLAGCGPKTVEVLQQGVDSGKSIVIFRKPQTVTHWARANGGAAGFAEALPAGGDYVAVAVAPGTYYVHSAFARTSDDLHLLETHDFDSRFGLARVRKTPEREIRDELIEYPAEYRWRTMRNGKRERVMVRPPEREWIPRVHAIQSYYETEYTFPPQGNGQVIIGSIEVKPREVLLVPSVWAYVHLAENACRLRGREEDPALWNNLPDGYGRYDPRLGLAVRRGDFDTFVWECPVAAIEIAVAPVSKADFMQHADLGDFPPGTVERLVVGEFMPGKLFTEPHEQFGAPDGSTRSLFLGQPQSGLAAPTPAAAKTPPASSKP